MRSSVPALAVGVIAAALALGTPRPSAAVGATAIGKARIVAVATVAARPDDDGAAPLAIAAAAPRVLAGPRPTSAPRTEAATSLRPSAPATASRSRSPPRRSS